MKDYLGIRCPVCDKKFTEDADIVVCPVCGAPHHRACYEQEGHCALEESHGTGKAWQSEPEGVSVPPPGSTAYTQNRQTHYPNMGSPEEMQRAHHMRYCQSCGTENPETNLFCNLCGQWLGDSGGAPQNPFAPGANRTNGGNGFSTGSYMPPLMGQQMQYNPKYALYGGLSPEEKIGDFTARDYATYIGKSSNYYIPRFKAVADSGRSFSLNISALFLHFFYFFYRKMYAIGSVLLAIFIVSSIPTIMYGKELMAYERHISNVGVTDEGAPVEPYDSEAEARLNHYRNMSSTSRFIYSMVSMLTSVVATRLYYEHSTRKMNKVLKGMDTGDLREGRCLECESTLERAGGVNRVLPVLAFVALYLTAGIYLILQRFL